MEKFEIFHKTHVVFGRSAEHEVGSLIKTYGGRRVLLVYGVHSAIRYGLASKIKMSLDRAGIDYAELPGVDFAARLSKVSEGIELCHAQHLDFVLALGGNSVADTAKAIAAGFYIGSEQLWALFSGQLRAVRMLAVGVVMTMNGLGSEFSGCCMLCGGPEQGGLRLYAASDLFQPVFTVLNPELTFTLSMEQTASGIAGIFSRLLAVYLDPGPGALLADSLSEGLMRSVCEAALLLREDPGDYEARACLMWAGTLCHSTLLQAGLRSDPTVRLLAQCLSSFYDISTGRALAVILPAWLEFVQVRCQTRLARLGANVLGCQLYFHDLSETAQQALLRLRAFFNAMHLPCNLREVGGGPGDIPDLLDHLRCYSLPEDQAEFDIGKIMHVEAILCSAACYCKPEDAERPALS